MVHAHLARDWVSVPRAVAQEDNDFEEPSMINKTHKISTCVCYRHLDP